MRRLEPDITGIDIERSVFSDRSRRGDGTQAAVGDRVTVAYTGWLYDSSRADGKGTQFDSRPSFPFTIGVGVIRGWSQGDAGMRVGGQRRLVIPPSSHTAIRALGPEFPPTRRSFSTSRC